MTNLKNPMILNEHMFAQGEIEIQKFLRESYSNCFKLLDTFWKEGIKLLQMTKTKCYELKPDLAEYLNAEFQELELLENIKFGSKVSKDNIEEVICFFLFCLLKG
jgi:hypothetical protein